MAGFASSWYSTLEGGRYALEQLWTEEPLLVVGLLIPCVLAMTSRSATAVATSVLLAGAGVITARIGADAPPRRSIILAICSAGLLVAWQGVLLHRARGQLHGTKQALSKIRDELTETRRKYEREMLWRAAAEKAANKSPASTSAAPEPH